MTMESENYKKVLSHLRKSNPGLDSADAIEREVLRYISNESKRRINLSEIFDFLFAWTYISWIRRSLIATSLALVVIFVVQQGIVLQKINYMSAQTISTFRESQSDYVEGLEKKLLVFKLSGRRLPSDNIVISERQINKILESVNELQLKYKDIANFIEGDTVLKKYIEMKLNEKSGEKTKL